MSKKLEITLNRSVIGRTDQQIKTIHTLGLKKINDTAVHDNSPSVRGMLTAVSHLVTVKEVD